MFYCFLYLSVLIVNIPYTLRIVLELLHLDSGREYSKRNVQISYPNTLVHVLYYFHKIDQYVFLMDGTTVTA